MPDGIFGIDWDGDGDVDFDDDMLTLEMLEEEEEEGLVNGGCYVATCVYGSYDCPEVWVLRRYRDHRLAQTAPGRLLIRAYYAVSPGVVARFGGRDRFRSAVRKQLDAFVTVLKRSGYADTPYRDAELRRR